MNQNNKVEGNLSVKNITVREFDKWKSKILLLMKETVEFNFPTNDVPDEYYREKCEELREYLQEKKAIVLIAVIEKKLTGWIWCHKIDRFDENRFHVAYFSVFPEWKKHGVGGLLLKEAEKVAIESGACGVDLFVTVSNSDAVDFYTHKGYYPERLLLFKSLNDWRKQP